MSLCKESLDLINYPIKTLYYSIMTITINDNIIIVDMLR
jgi:hypothetical protein